MSKYPTVIFVHGAWHGAWSWAPLQAKLDKIGVPSIAVDLPGHSTNTQQFTDMHGDARYVAQVAANIGGDIILVGHSYGGGVIGQAAAQLRGNATANVVHLVYMAAFVLDVGESVGGLAAELAKQSPVESNMLGSAMIPGPDGLLLLDPVGAVDALYNECSKKMTKAAIARLSPQPAITFSQPTNGAPWKLIPSTYVVCEKDNAVHPEHQRLMAARCSKVISISADHSPFMCMPKESAKIIAKIAGK
jgi:pimeloyl-ACP methyl ester carboxylesterase